MTGLVRVTADGTVIADKVVYADTYQLRRKGLLGKDRLEANEGALLVMPCKTGLSLLHSIHMFGVPFDLAVAWLDLKGQIIQTKRAKPGRMYFPPGFFTDTAYILELHPQHLSLLQSAPEITWEDAGGRSA